MVARFDRLPPSHHHNRLCKSLVIVWAVSIVSHGLVAVVAQDTKPFGKLIFDDPFNHLRTASDSTTMGVASAIDMVQCEKFKMGLLATLTLSTIMGNDLLTA